jgi:CRP-like cAMP-binding protein
VAFQRTPKEFSPELLLALQGIKSVQLFPRGTTLFDQGSAADGIYVVESGEVRMLLPTGQQRKQLLEVVGPGAVLGLSESMTDESHRITAEANEETTVAFIPREQFLEFLREHNNFSMQVVRMLSQELRGLYQKFRNITAHPGRPRQCALNEQLN